MNRDKFELLSEEKKETVQKAYQAAFNKEIGPNDFFEICKQTLTEEEYEFLFNQELATEQQNEEIKTEHIEDIMQYTGVDLREEAEKIVKEAEYNVGYEPADNKEDRNLRIDSLFNPVLFQDFVLRVSAQRQMKISNDSIFLIFRIIQRKITDLISKLENTSKVRVEAYLSDFNFKIQNEVSKQLWYLNEMEKVLQEKLQVKKEDDSKKKKVIQEREDLVIKKRQSSSVAMAAMASMGIEQKSWMIGDGLKSLEDNSNFTPIYSPFDEKGYDNRIKNRTITLKDFIYVLEKDKRYNKSIFLVQYYFK
jgi:hypothetical protein